MVRIGILALGGILVMSTAAFGQRKFDHIQYQTWTKEQKNGDHPLKGSVVFDSNKKAVEFLDEKGDSILIIPTDKITNPMVVDYKARLLKVDYLLTIRYTDIEGADKSVVITLHKGNLRDVLLAAATETRKEVFHKDGCCPVF